MSQRENNRNQRFPNLTFVFFLAEINQAIQVYHHGEDRHPGTPNKTLFQVSGKLYALVASLHIDAEKNLRTDTEVSQMAYCHALQAWTRWCYALGALHCYINWILSTKYSTLYKKRQTKIRSRHTLVGELQ